MLTLQKMFDRLNTQFFEEPWLTVGFHEKKATWTSLDA
jgi:hypothetical protein